MITAGGTPGDYGVAYTIVDADGKTASANISVRVDYPFNNPPVANPDTFTVFPNQPMLLNVLQNDTDAEGGALDLVSVTQPANGGSVEKVGNQVRFLADSSGTGTSQFSYTITDAGPPAKQATGTVLVTLAPCQDPVPVLSDKTFTTPYVTPLSANLFNASDVRKGNISITQPAVGSVALGSEGAFVYTPPSGFNDNAVFSYTVTNICGATATAKVTIDVNRRPTAGAVTSSTGKNKSVAIAVAASDPDLDALTPVVVPGSAVGGTAVVDGAGFRFSPAPAFTGQATFQYYVVDVGGLQSSPATVTVNVANTPPVAGNFTTSMFVDTPAVTYNVLQPPTADIDGDTITLRPTVDVSPAGAGTASVSGNNVVFTRTGNLTPNTAITLTYRITDGEPGPPVAGTVTILVQNRVPVAGTDTASGLGPIAVNVLLNDADPDGDSLTVTGAAVESVSRVIPDPPPSTTGSGEPVVTVGYTASTVTYSVSDPTFTGTIVLAYTISDGRGGTATGKINISVS